MAEPSTSDFLEDYYAKQAKRKAEIPERAEALRQKLLALGVAVVVSEYDGSGDSGQINGTSFAPETVTVPPSIEEETTDLFYDFLSAHHGGWENNDGGRGEFNWNIATNEFHLEHHDYYTESNMTAHDGWKG